MSKPLIGDNGPAPNRPVKLPPPPPRPGRALGSAGDDARKSWSFQAQIDATHPALDASGELEIEADTMAMKLVGERHEKRDLVNLVRWLILRQPFMILPGRSQWKPIATAPHNRRVFIYGRHPEGHEEGAMGWWDIIDGRWYYAPQGGVVDRWTPEWWMPIPFPLPNPSR